MSTFLIIKLTSHSIALRYFGRSWERGQVYYSSGLPGRARSVIAGMGLGLFSFYTYGLDHSLEVPVFLLFRDSLTIRPTVVKCTPKHFAIS